MKTRVCMIVPNRLVQGGIAAVVNGYRGSVLEQDCDITYVESYCDGSKLRKLLKAISSYICFLFVLLLQRPDVVHIHSSFGPSFYRKLPFINLSFAWKIPIVNHIHGAEFDDFYTNAGASKQQLIQRAYNKCQALIALSDEWKENLSRIVQADKIHVIENYSVLQELHTDKRNHNQILFLGEIGKRKGCFDIPAVVQKVSEKIPECHFVLAGAGQAKELLSELQEKKLSAFVSFPGWVRGEEKDRLLRECDIFFLPSYNEGMPMSILDAMGYGLPIVSTLVGGIPKLVISGENGFLEQPGESERFAQDIIQLLTDEKLRMDAGRKSYEIVRDGYTLEAHLRKLEQVYKQVLVR